MLNWQNRYDFKAHNIAPEDTMWQMLSLRAECWSPKKYKSVHASLKEGLHGSKEGHSLVCKSGKPFSNVEANEGMVSRPVSKPFNDLL